MIFELEFCVAEQSWITNSKKQMSMKLLIVLANPGLYGRSVFVFVTSFYLCLHFSKDTKIYMSMTKSDPLALKAIDYAHGG